MNPAAPLTSSLQDAILVEAVQLVEETGPLDDAQAMRTAAALQPDGAGRIIERARILGQRIGLQAEFARARTWAPWVLLGLVAVVVLAALALAGGVTGQAERRINVVVTLTSLLGLHLLTLLMWLAGLWWPAGGGSLNASFGGLWLALTARVAGGRRGQAPLLLGAATRVLARARLLPWALGFASHLVWALSFSVVLAALLFALAFRSYTLTWETTILEPAFFVRGVQWLGWMPARLGFPVPDAQAVLSPLASAAAQRDWALWLTGCVLVYGLLPRVLLALLSAGVWRARRGALQPDLSQPGHRRLLARFEAMAPRHIVDADPGHAPHEAPIPLAADGTRDMLVAIGFELPDEMPWPPVPIEAHGGVHLRRIDGSAAATHALLDELAGLRPRRALVGCHAASSPDRGTERFLREVASHCGECRLWLVSAPDDTRAGDLAAARERWRAWLAGAGLGSLAIVDSARAALRERNEPLT